MDRKNNGAKGQDQKIIEAQLELRRLLRGQADEKDREEERKSRKVEKTIRDRNKQQKSQVARKED